MYTVTTSFGFYCEINDRNVSAKKNQLLDQFFLFLFKLFNEALLVVSTFYLTWKMVRMFFQLWFTGFFDVATDFTQGLLQEALFHLNFLSADRMTQM